MNKPFETENIVRFLEMSLNSNMHSKLSCITFSVEPGIHEQAM